MSPAEKGHAALEGISLKSNPSKGKQRNSGTSAILAQWNNGFGVWKSHKMICGKLPLDSRTDNVPGGYGGQSAEPMGTDMYTKCKKIRLRVSENNRLVSDRGKEVSVEQTHEPHH